jgi:hypothetical protein
MLVPSDTKDMTATRALYEASLAKELADAARQADVLARYTERYFIYALGR